MSRETNDHISSVVAAAVAETIKQNGHSNGSIPKNVTELVWKGAMTLGVPTVCLGVIFLIVYQTLPGWVNASIKTQESLTQNLDQQTENLEKQTEILDVQSENLHQASETLESLSGTVAEIVKIEQDTVEFQAAVQQEHAQCMSDHVEQMEKLVSIEAAASN